MTSSLFDALLGPVLSVAIVVFALRVIVGGRLCRCRCHRCHRR